MSISPASSLQGIHGYCSLGYGVIVSVELERASGDRNYMNFFVARFCFVIPVTSYGRWVGPWGVALLEPRAAVLKWSECKAVDEPGWRSEMPGVGHIVGKV